MACAIRRSRACRRAPLRRSIRCTRVARLVICHSAIDARLRFDAVRARIPDVAQAVPQSADLQAWPRFLPFFTVARASSSPARLQQP